VRGVGGVLRPPLADPELRGLHGRPAFRAPPGAAEVRQQGKGGQDVPLHPPSQLPGLSARTERGLYVIPKKKEKKKKMNSLCPFPTFNEAKVWRPWGLFTELWEGLWVLPWRSLGAGRGDSVPGRLMARAGLAAGAPPERRSGGDCQLDTACAHAPGEPQPGGGGPSLASYTSLLHGSVTADPLPSLHPSQDTGPANPFPGSRLIRGSTALSPSFPPRSPGGFAGDRGREGARAAAPGRGERARARQSASPRSSWGRCGCPTAGRAPAAGRRAPARPGGQRHLRAPRRR